MKGRYDPLLKVRKPTISPLLKSTILIGLICLSALLMVGGLFICSTLEGAEQFLMGVVLVVIGMVLLGVFRELIMGVGT